MPQPKLSQEVKNIALRLQQVLDLSEHQNVRIGVNVLAERGIPRHTIVDVQTIEPKAANLKFLLELLGVAYTDMGHTIVISSAEFDQMLQK